MRRALFQTILQTTRRRSLTWDNGSPSYWSYYPYQPLFTTRLLIAVAITGTNIINYLAGLN